MSFIHGLRVFHLAQCAKTNALVLQGSAGMHLHSALQKEAECRGISGAMWMTETAKERNNARHKAGGPKVPHDGPAPDWDCTCGAYFFRTMADAFVTDSNVYAHVTCLGRTMLHTSGGRTTQYSVDYLIAPEKEGQVATGPPVSYPFFYYAPVSFVGKNLRASMDIIGRSLNVPVLDRRDLKGCPECLLVNKWREPDEITRKMREDWFGESYHE